MNRSACKAIFFDVGNTLIQPWPSVGAVYAAVGQRFGFNALPETMEEGFRQAWRRSRSPETAPGVAMAEKRWWRRLVFDALVLAGLDGDEPTRQAYFEELYAVFARPESWRLYPDAVEALGAARDRGRHVGVISNWDARLRPLLHELGVMPWLDSLTVSCEVRAAKPAAQIFCAALQAAGVNPGDAIHIGDSYDEDVLGAKGVGMQAVLIARRAGGAYDCVTVTDLRQVLAMV